MLVFYFTFNSVGLKIKQSNITNSIHEGLRILNFISLCSYIYVNAVFYLFIYYTLQELRYMEAVIVSLKKYGLILLILSLMIF